MNFCVVSIMIEQRGVASKTANGFRVEKTSNARLL